MLRSILFSTLCSLSTPLPFTTLLLTISTTAASPVSIIRYPYSTSTSRSPLNVDRSNSGGSFIGKFASPNYPNPEPCTGNCSWIHDPSVIKDGDKYYRFSTSGNIAIATAPAIGGPWTYQGALLTNGTSIFVNKAQDIWAPNVIKIGNTYYCYYAVSFIGSQDSQIGVATSTSLDSGTWTDHGSYNIPKSSAYNLIDPSVLQEKAGGPIYFTFGSFWNGIFQAKIDEGRLLDFTRPTTSGANTNGTSNSTNTTTTTSNNATTTTAPAAAASLPVLNDITRNSTANAAVIEGATMYKSPSSQYFYLLFSAGNCCAVPPNLPATGGEYRTLVCRSDNAEGPFVDEDEKACMNASGGWGGTTILASHGDVYAPGGQGVMDDGGRTVLYYHYVKPSVGFSATQFFFGYNYLEFQNGWPVVVAK